MAAKRLVRTNRPEATQATSPANEAKFGLDVWLVNSKKMIGQPRHVIVGATYGRDADELYSKSTMTVLAKRFLSMR